MLNKVARLHVGRSYLFSPVGDRSDIGRDLAHLSTLLPQTLVYASSVTDDAVQVFLRTHFPYKLLDSLVKGIIAKVKLGGHPLGLVGECHAALMLSIKGTDKLDLLLRFGANGGFL